MDDEKCPKCGIAAASVKYRERKRKASKAPAAPAAWIREYHCPVGHKWTRVMVRSGKID
jgi:hypothetical protein